MNRSANGSTFHQAYFAQSAWIVRIVAVTAEDRNTTTIAAVTVAQHVARYEPDQRLTARLVIIGMACMYANVGWRDSSVWSCRECATPQPSP